MLRSRRRGYLIIGARSGMAVYPRYGSTVNPRRDLLLRPCACVSAIFLSRETIYRQRSRRRSGAACSGANAIPRRDTPKPKSRRYRTVDADYWPMIPISRWHLRAVIIVPPYSIGRDDRDAADLVSLRAFAYGMSRQVSSTRSPRMSYTREFNLFESWRDSTPDSCRCCIILTRWGHDTWLTELFHCDAGVI